MGTRVAALARASGINVVLAGRPSSRLAAEAERLDMPWRSADLTRPAALDAMLVDVQIVLNAAGPFSHTAAEIMRACLRNQCHYLDLSNEVATFLDAWSLDSAAQQAAVNLVPGAGFGTAAAEALAAHVLGRIEEPVSLTIARSSRGGVSTPGVNNTRREILARPRAGIKDDKWQTQGHKIISIKLPDGQRSGIPVGLGDAFAVAQATGIPQVNCYAVTGMSRSMARIAIPLVRLLTSAGRAESRTSPRQRRKMRQVDQEGTQLWIQAKNTRGDTSTSCLNAGSGSDLAARIALQAVQQLHLHTGPGVLTSGQLIGVHNILKLPGIHITDL